MANEAALAVNFTEVYKNSDYTGKTILNSGFMLCNQNLLKIQISCNTRTASYKIRGRKNRMDLKLVFSEPLK